jgi:hypothetical protein
MEQQCARKTYQYKLKPRAEQELALDRTLMLCRHVYRRGPESPCVQAGDEWPIRLESTPALSVHYGHT